PKAHARTPSHRERAVAATDRKPSEIMRSSAYQFSREKVPPWRSSRRRHSAPWCCRGLSSKFLHHHQRVRFLTLTPQRRRHHTIRFESKFLIDPSSPRVINGDVQFHLIHPDAG